MRTHRVSRPLSIILTAVVVAAAASGADAAALRLQDVQFPVDDVTLTATFSAGLEADTDDGSDIFLDGLSVDLAQDGTFLDLFAGPTLLDDLPFFLDVPPTLADGETLPVSLLFRHTGLTAGATYTGSFALLFSAGLDSGLFTAPALFSFSTAEAPAPVPEPATLILMATGLGATGLLQRRRRRQARP